MEKETVEEIQKLGLNNYEAKIYLALLARDTLSVSEIARLSRVPRVRTYDILEKLVSRGLASLKPGKFMRYSAVDLDFLKSKFIEQINQRYSEEKSHIEKVTLKLRKQLEPTLEKRNSHINNPFDYIEIIKDPYRIHRKFIELARTAQKEILVFVKPPYTTPPKDTLKERDKCASTMVNKGITIRNLVMIPQSKEEIEWQCHELRIAVKAGEQIRVIRNLPIKMALFDEKIVMLPLEDPVSTGTSFTTQIIEHAPLAQALKLTFETLWQQAEDYHVLEDILETM